MGNLHFEVPSPCHKFILLEYKQEFLDSGDSMDGSSGLGWAASFEEWLHTVQQNASPDTALPDCVPCTVYLAMENQSNRLVGMICIRHQLTSTLERFGGNIGYSVRQSERGNGYAVQMLQMALERCKEMGLHEVLLTCYKHNVASSKTMLRCGAKLQDEITAGEYVIQRYKISV